MLMFADQPFNFCVQFLDFVSIQRDPVLAFGPPASVDD